MATSSVEEEQADGGVFSADLLRFNLLRFNRTSVEIQTEFYGHSGDPVIYTKFRQAFHMRRASIAA